MATFNFDRLLKKYSVKCLLEVSASAGKWIGGEWVPDVDAKPQEIKGAVIPMTDQKVYQSGGTYTLQDREFLTKTEIPLEAEAHIVHEEQRFKVLPNADYGHYAEFYAYYLKRVSAFDRSEKT